MAWRRLQNMRRHGAGAVLGLYTWVDVYDVWKDFVLPPLRRRFGEDAIGKEHPPSE